MTRRTAAWLIGLVPSGAVVTACRLLEVDDDLTAGLLVPPVAVSGWLAGRAVGVRVALLVGVAYAVALLAPFGHVRIGFTHDMAVVALFVAVAFVVGTLADRRRPPSPEPPPLPPAGGNELLHAVSHDLRNPLSTIRAASADLLTGGYADDTDKRDELLTLVRSESERLDRIVGNLLQAGRVQSGRLAPELGPESIAAVLADAAVRLRRLHPHEILVEAPDPSPVVMADAVQIDQVLSNLVDNAARVSPAGSTIRLCARAADGVVVVEVDDGGPGFEGDAVRDPFAPHVSGTGSTGLGLAVCRAIVHAHGGTIEAGRSPAGGGRVRFTLPLSDV